MWPWQRARRAHPDPEPPAVDGPAVRRADWRTLPPIQRTFDPLRPVSPQQEMGESLTSWRNPSFLAPLGHLVSADAPTGVIHRLIEPAPPPARPAGPPLEFTAAPARGGAVQRFLAAMAPRASRAGPPAPSRPDDGGSSAPPPLAAPATDPGPTPVHRPVTAAPVQRSAAGTTPMTRAPAPVMPVLELPVVGRSATPEQTAAQPPAVAADAEPPAPAVPPAEDAAPPAEDAVSAVEEGEVGEVPTLGMIAPPSATEPADGRAGGSADVSGQERRASVPAVETVGRPARTEPVQRTVDSVPAPGPVPGRAGAVRRLGLGPPLAADAVTAQRSPASPVSTPPPTTSPAIVPASSTTAPPPVTIPPSSSSAAAGEGADVDDDAGGDGHSGVDEIAPLLGRPSSIPGRLDTVQRDTVQRDDEVLPPDTGQPAETSPHPAEPPLPVLRVHESTASSGSTVSASMGPGPVRVPVPDPLPVVARLVGERIPPLRTVPPAVAPAGSRRQPHQGEPAQVQRLADQLVPGQSSPAGHWRESGQLGDSVVPARPVNTPPTPPAGYPQTTLPPAPLSVQLMSPAGGRTLQTDVRPVSRGRTAGPAAAADLPVQRNSGGVVPTLSRAELPPADIPTAETPAIPTPAAEAPAVGAPGAEAAAVEPAAVEPAAAGAPAAGAPGAGAAAGAANPDELVKKLYDPLLRRLKNELRLDRERRGMLTDLHH